MSGCSVLSDPAESFEHTEIDRSPAHGRWSPAKTVRIQQGELRIAKSATENALRHRTLRCYRLAIVLLTLSFVGVFISAVYQYRRAIQLERIAAPGPPDCQRDAALSAAHGAAEPPASPQSLLVDPRQVHVARIEPEVVRALVSNDYEGAERQLLRLSHRSSSEPGRQDLVTAVQWKSRCARRPTVGADPCD